MINKKLNDKIISIIGSCKTIEQWFTAKKLVENIIDKNIVDIYNIILVLGIKYGVLINKNN